MFNSNRQDFDSLVNLSILMSVIFIITNFRVFSGLCFLFFSYLILPNKIVYNYIKKLEHMADGVLSIKYPRGKFQQQLSRYTIKCDNPYRTMRVEMTRLRPWRDFSDS